MNSSNTETDEKPVSDVNDQYFEEGFDDQGETLEEEFEGTIIVKYTQYTMVICMWGQTQIIFTQSNWYDKLADILEDNENLTPKEKKEKAAQE